MIKNLLTLLLVCLLTNNLQAQSRKDTIALADPTIFYTAGTYYLYGTGSPDGFPVYTSKDLINWDRSTAKALSRGDTYGTGGFWAPQVFTANKKFYMAYAANEHIALAQAPNPIGPFKQATLHSVSLPGRQIDPYIFRDTNGQRYMYYVNLKDGNRIYTARLKQDLTDVDATTVTACLEVSAAWENTSRAPWPVAEGPTVIKVRNLYYLFYSANDYRNIDYAVGYATAPSPLGPWTKFSGNPILSRLNTSHNGSGHGDVFTGKDGKLYYVFHTHQSQTKTGRRKTAIIELVISDSNPAVISVVPNTFRYLLADGLDRAL